MTSPVGLCEHCANARPIQSRRGSRFWLCTLHASDDRFRKFPPLPVLECPGFRDTADGSPEQ